MADDRHFFITERVDKLGEIINESVHRIIAFRRPFAVSMPAKIRANHMPIVAQLFGHPIPIPAVISTPVLQNQRRRVGIAPIDIIKAQTL